MDGRDTTHCGVNTVPPMSHHAASVQDENDDMDLDIPLSDLDPEPHNAYRQALLESKLVPTSAQN